MAGKFAAGLPVEERHEFERRQRELGAVLDAQHQQASELSAKLDAVRTCLCLSAPRVPPCDATCWCVMRG